MHAGAVLHAVMHAGAVLRAVMHAGAVLRAVMHKGAVLHALMYHKSKSYTLCMPHVIGHPKKMKLNELKKAGIRHNSWQ